MVYVVDAANSAQFGIELGNMYRDRFRVLDKSSGVRAQRPALVQDRDRFDSTKAIYLLLADENNSRHLASLRLLPTIEPHLLSELGTVFCECGSPIAPDIWELSWMCVSPDLSRLEGERTRAMLRLAMAEFAVARGIRQFVAIACAQVLPEMMAAGWRAKP